jgi:very-short-patch-repair endonuclease
VAGFWTDLPVGRVVSLRDRTAESVALALEPLPADAPAVVVLRPSGRPVSWSAFILDELDSCARALFPAWLPGAERITGPAGLGVVAVRAIAMRAAAGSAHHGPFLADLAERALKPAPSSGFPAAVRAAGLARVIAASYGRSRLALVVEVPSPEPDGLVSACEHLAFAGSFAVWLTGDGSTAASTEAPAVSFPPVAGRPHPASRAEQALENALAARDWATGRAWNQTYDLGPLINPVRLDLLWSVERCVVEVDGPEHYAEPRYEADRRRDVELQLAGYAVLRFTNAQIYSDVHAVLGRIERFLQARRLVQKG